MTFSLRELYYYLVSFVTLIMVIIGLVQLVNAGLDFFEPDAPYLNRVEPRGAAEMRLRDLYPEASDEELSRLIDEELARQRENAEAYEQYWRWRRLIGALAFLGISLPVYRYHWRLARRLEEKR